METIVSCEVPDSLRSALNQRRDCWTKLDLHIWFDVFAECNSVCQKLEDMCIRIQMEGHDDFFLRNEQTKFIESLCTAIRHQVQVLQSLQVAEWHDARPDVVQTLARILCDSFVGAYATIDDPRDGVVHLLRLAVKSRIHKTILVAFTGQAAEYVLSLMTRRNLERNQEEPIRALWLDHRSSMLRILLKLSRRSETVPETLFLKGVECNERELPIASGGNAEIFSAQLGGCPVVLKRLRAFQAVRGGKENIKEFCREALLWSQLSHPFVQVFLGVDKDTFESRYCMVTPWMVNGNIRECMDTLVSIGRPVPYDRWLLELSIGMEYLHQEDVIHGDIRGNNLLIDDDLHIRITDFGLAAYATSNTTSVGNLGGSTRWMSPELLNPDTSGIPTYQSDVYAFGITCVEIYTRQQPFPNLVNQAQVIQRVLKGDRPPRPTRETGASRPMSFALWVLIESCWAHNPSERPHIVQVVTSIRDAIGIHPPLTGVRMMGSTFEELIHDDSLVELTTTTPPRFRFPLLVAYAPYIPITLVILIYLSISLWTVLGSASNKVVLFFPIFMTFFIQMVYARVISSWIRNVTGWEVDARAVVDYCKHSILAGFGILFLLFPVMALSGR